MKKYFAIALLLGATMGFTSCSEDDLNPTSIFEETTEQRDEFEQWIYDNFTKPYNITLNFRYDDKETDNQYNVIPADVEKSKALAIMVKHVWIDAYEEVMGHDFLATYAPKAYQFLGSAEYDTNGSMVLGTAEGGIKITLFRVNSLDIDNPWIDQSSSFPDTERTPLDLNYWFFHTMHHEFCHILTQTKDYTTDFRTVSAGKYQTTNWVNIEDKDAPVMGFTSGYGSGEYNEDFAEIYSFYVTHTEQAWQNLLAAGVSESGDTSGRDAIVAKFDILHAYFKDSWGVNLEDLRAVVLRRSSEVSTLDLRTLK